ncbi:flagellar hook assembly protein FlgD [Salinarimonas ramus]|uniref:Basal-body rod modification protein FlgD n=1 Tax=Salinarimonas ramus TaxID=690164 RepID=A0A917Q6Z1_9HYPH|nr:flagellar hook assembly protein FlgD [Salinarimonas ramus]GGK33130.1 flagellar basal body rod modification protein FlgD [Salinarimonas ramus]
MDVASATAAQPGTQADNAGRAGASSPGSMDYDSFLRLLIAQMKNQDPLNPMDPSEQVAQLATFSMVEQAIMTNKKLDGLLSATSLAQASDLIGRTATSADGRISGEVTGVRLTDEGPLATLDGGETLLVGPGVRLT